MKLVLSGLRTLELIDSQKPAEKVGFKVLRTQYCAICKTDAKMWHQGHRDLVFPRVPGHEIVALDHQQNRFVIWPGSSCGGCIYCKSGRENLCEDMKILGFHHDGGFAKYVQAPQKSLVPLPPNISSKAACFAEPVGCVLNVLEKVQLKRGERVIIYGGGTVGLIAALVAINFGAIPLVIEKNEEKIFNNQDFLQKTGISCQKDTTEADFDVAINACPDPIAFCLCVTKLAKGGRLGFFSGLNKNKNIESNLLNLMHYKEIGLLGAYGLTKKNMESSLTIIGQNQAQYENLIEGIISPEITSSVLPDILVGKPLKYLLDFSSDIAFHGIKNPEKTKLINIQQTQKEGTTMSKINIKTIANSITASDESFMAAAQHKIDNKTKPLGALGTLEELAVKISVIQNTLNPTLNRKSLFVFAADHGIVEEGVSAFPSEVTAQMVENFLAGGAAINVLCKHNDVDIKIIDAGVKVDFNHHPELITKKVRQGTRNFAIEPAMTEEEANQTIENGMAIFFEENTKEKIDILGLGEMGIGNTTSATAIICAITGLAVREATGRGTGIDDKGLEHKSKVITNALNFHKLNKENGLEILQKVGGYEIAGIVGAVLAAASQKTVVVLDGVISTAAGLLAYLINPKVKDYLISGHKSVEVAQKAALAFMGIQPVLDLNMRLGEGTGAAMTIDLADASCCIMRDMASFEDAGVSGKI